MTNSEMMRKMTDEELAEFLTVIDWCHTCGFNGDTCNMDACKAHILWWLKREVKEDE